MDVIADASSLIVLARLDSLWLLERVLESVVIVRDVEIETVVQGRAKRYPDAEKIAAAISAGHLKVISPTRGERRLADSFLRNAPTLSRADCLLLACARERNLTLLMEEKRGRNMAVAQGVDYVTIQALPLHGFMRARLSFAECDDLLLRIGRTMRTDEAILKVLRAAAKEIHRLRLAQ